MKEGSTVCPCCGKKQKVNDVKKPMDVEQKIQLKVPFMTKGGDRIDDTPVHEAVREAFANRLNLRKNK